MEQFLNGSSIIIVENGEIVKENLMQAKMSEQQLYMQLREKGIHDVKSLQQVTAEPNGRIGRTDLAHLYISLLIERRAL